MMNLWKNYFCIFQLFQTQVAVRHFSNVVATSVFQPCGFVMVTAIAKAMILTKNHPLVISKQIQNVAQGISSVNPPHPTLSHDVLTTSGSVTASGIVPMVRMKKDVIPDTTLLISLGIGTGQKVNMKYN